MIQIIIIIFYNNNNNSSGQSDAVLLHPRYYQWKEVVLQNYFQAFEAQRCKLIDNLYTLYVKCQMSKKFVFCHKDKREMLKFESIALCNFILSFRIAFLPGMQCFQCVYSSSSFA